MRRIKKARITFISLCPKGKNKMPVLYKSDGTVEFEALTKASDDAGELLNVVYAPELRDSDGDIASVTVIKAAAYDAAKRGVDIDVWHDGKPVGKDRAFVAENFIIAKGDERFREWKDTDGKPVDVTGGWATVIKIEDPNLRRLYKADGEGAWGGVSMFGEAEVVAEKADDEAPSWFVKALKAIGLGGKGTTNGEIDMEKQELLDALKGFSQEIVKAIKPDAKDTVEKADPELDINDPEAVKAHLAKLEKANAPKPDFDINDAKAVEAHAAKLRTDELKKGIDFADPKQVEAYLAKLNGDVDDDVLEKADDSDDVKELKRRLAKAEGRSNQPAPKADDDAELEFAGLSKADAKAAQRGSAMASFINKQNAR